MQTNHTIQYLNLLILLLDLGLNFDKKEEYQSLRLYRAVQIQSQLLADAIGCVEISHGTNIKDDLHDIIEEWNS